MRMICKRNQELDCRRSNTRLFQTISQTYSFMLRNYFLTALRNIKKHKAYSAINILGLSLGLACSFFIVLWVQDEVNFNRFHEHETQLYRVMRHADFGGERVTTASIPKPLDDALRTDYPEITHTALMDWGSNMVVTQGDLAFRADGRHFGADVFQMFSFPLIVGDAEEALTDPTSIVLSESLAEKFFGADWQTKEDLIGTPFQIDNTLEMTLTGVFEDVPSNSSMQFDFVLPMESFISRNDWVENWGNNGLRLFVRLQGGVSGEQVSAKLKDLIDEHVDQWETDVFLQPIADMYLRSNYEGGVQMGGRIEYVNIFGLVALFIILIASINFMNLATARSAQRAREIGVRKSFGASRWSLAWQFLGESVLTALLALIVALVLVYLLIPSFNELTDKTVSITVFDPKLWLQFGGLALMTGIFAGLYPALYLSSFGVIDVFRGHGGKAVKGGVLRKGLVVFQFMMSIILIVGTFTVYQQLNYIRDKDLGLDRENVVYFGYEGGVRDQFETFKQEMLREPSIVNMASSSSNPLQIGQDTIDPRWEGKDPNDNTLYSVISAGYGFVETMDITLLEGRLFSEEFGADSSNFILNETAAERMGMEEPLGQGLAMWGREGVIVGVVKDFHMRSLYQPIEPVIMRLSPENTWMVFVRTAAGQTPEALAALERIYSKFNPEYPLNYQFMDEEFEDMYRSEIVIGTLANIFAILAILIACLGLFGLASFTAERRSKEIGIRKVLGASVSSVMVLLSREFIVLVVGAFLVAAPLAYIIMNNWLDEFEFHQELGIGVLVIAGFASVAIAWFTVSYQSYRAAAANPVDALRSE